METSSGTFCGAKVEFLNLLYCHVTDNDSVTCENTKQGRNEVSYTCTLTKNFKDAQLHSPTRNKVNSKATLGGDGEPQLFPLPQKQIIRDGNGKPTICFSDLEMHQFTHDLQFTLVEKFSYGYLALHVIKKEFHKLRLTGEYFVGILNVRHVLIKLSNEIDYMKVWDRGMLRMDKFPMRILKWTKDFNPAVESSVAPVWIKLPNLLYCLFHKEALWRLPVLWGNP